MNKSKGGKLTGKLGNRDERATQLNSTLRQLRQRIIKDNPLKTSCGPFVTLVVDASAGCERNPLDTIYLSLVARAPWIWVQTSRCPSCFVCALQKSNCKWPERRFRSGYSFTSSTSLRVQLVHLGIFLIIFDTEEVATRLRGTQTNSKTQNTQLTLPHLCCGNIEATSFLNFNFRLRTFLYFLFSVFWRAFALLTRL